MANIRTAGRSGFIRRGGVRRRETLWLGGTVVRSTIASANSAVIQTSLSAGALALRPFTVIRTRGVFSVASDQEAADEFIDCAFGAAVVSDEAVAIGVSAVPTPSTDNDSDLWHVYERILDQFTFASGVGFQGQSSRMIQVDSKAMRKVEDGQDLVDVVETGPGSGGVFAVTFNRALLKLH